MTQCPCGRTYETGEWLSGRRLRCTCGRILTIGTPFVYEAPTTEPVGARAADHRSTEGPTADSTGGSAGTAALFLGAIAVFLFLVFVMADRAMTPPPVQPAPRRVASASSGPSPLERYARPPATTPTCPAADVLRPRTSRELAPFSSTGHGRLTIDNGTGLDAVAVLVHAYDEHPYRAIYIRAGEKGIFTRIAQGSYYLRFQFGADWTRQRRFCEIHGTEQFVEVLDFTERLKGDVIEYAVFEVTLHRIAGGNARTEVLASTEFELPPL